MIICLKLSNPLGEYSYHEVEYAPDFLAELIEILYGTSNNSLCDILDETTPDVTLESIELSRD